MYTRTFATFAGSALVDAMNGQAIPDFHMNRETKLPDDYSVLPKDQRVLSATIARVMNVMITRVNPANGSKIHEITSLQDVSMHTLEKYRSAIPMHARIFKMFRTQCQLYRKILSGLNFPPEAKFGGVVVQLRPKNKNVSIKSERTGADIANTEYRDDDNKEIPPVQFVLDFERVAEMDIPNATVMYLDELVNSMSSLIEDVDAVQKELNETDAAVPLYFDVKKNFTKNYFSSSNELPFAPLSVLAMGYNTSFDSVAPIPISRQNQMLSTKFAYGMRSLLLDNFKLSSAKIPYLKKLLSDFNGYATASNHISEDKYNDVLNYVGRAAGFIFDLRFYNGRAISGADIISDARMYPHTAASTASWRAYRAWSTYNRNAPIDRAALRIAVCNAALPPDSDIPLTKSICDVIEAAMAAADPRDLPKAVFNSAYTAIAALDPHNKPLLTFQERESGAAAMTLIESVNVIVSRNKIANYVKEIGSIEKPPTIVLNALNGNPRMRAIMINIIDAQIMPINVHSLMREIPLANLYNYAITFDACIEKSIPENFGFERQLLRNPYAPANVNQADDTIFFQINDARSMGSKFRFIDDILVEKIQSMYQKNIARVKQRFDTKIYRNLHFLTLVQYAIAATVRNNLQLVNTRVVENINAVGHKITNYDDEPLKDNLFEF